VVGDSNALDAFSLTGCQDLLWLCETVFRIDGVGMEFTAQHGEGASKQGDK